MAQPSPESIARLFHQVCDLSEEDRRRFLDEACVDEPELRKQVEALVTGDQGTRRASLTEIVDKAAREFGDAAPRETAADAKVIGPYTIRERIGTGGFGDVFLADQTQPVRRRVALKVLKRGMDTRSVLARFEAEAQALAMMDHPGIAKVFDAGETEQGLPYFAMEYVPGQPITEFCDRHRLTMRQRLELMISVCRAVQHAHGKGIIHRDLKPSNILVTEVDSETTPKVIDFGIAKATATPLTTRTIHTMHDHIIGTPAYMSPEQVYASGVDVDTRTDVYSLGVILYELLTGSQPIESDSLQTSDRDAIRQRIKEMDPDKPSARVNAAGADTTVVASRRRTEPSILRRQLRGELDWITMKALDKERTRRYETASALAADIERYLHGEAVEAGPPGARYRFGKFVRRHKLVFGAASATFLGTLIAAAALLFALVDSNRQRARVQAALEETQQARAAAEAVTSFVTGMLGAANPAVQGREVTVVEVLDRATAAIQEDLGDRPGIEARVRDTIGQTYFELGQFDAAVEQLKRTVSLYAELRGELDPATVAARRALARAYRESGDFDTAETQMRALLALEESAGSGVGSRAQTLDELGAVLTLKGSYEDAEPVQTRADRLAREAFGDDDPQRALILANLGVLQRLIGRHEEARAALTHALDVLEKEFGPGNPNTMVTAANLAIVNYQVGDYEEAARRLGELAETQTRVLGEEHASTLQTLNDQAAVLNTMERFVEAEAIAVPVLEARRRTLGPEHSSTLQSMNNVALVYGNLGRPADAERLLRESLVIKDRVLGPDHRDTIVTRGNLGDLLTEIGRAEEALGFLESALTSAERTLPDDHPRRYDVQRKLGECLRVLGQSERAETVLMDAYERLQAKVGPDHKYTRAAAKSLAALYDDTGRAEAAAEWRKKQ